MYSVLRSGLCGALGLFAVLVVRGQITEAPATVAPGKFLVEMDALSLFFDREEGLKYTGVGVASTFLTTGVAQNLDVQIGADLYLSQKFDASGLKERATGIGDVYLRTKWRFFNNESTGSSAAVMPYVVLPTNTGGVGSHGLQGGVIVPWEQSLSAAGTLNAMVEWDVVRNDDDDGYDSFWYATMSLTRPVTEKIGLYAEATAGKSSGGRPWEGMIGGGLTWQVGPFWWWDFAVYRGVSRAATDWNPVVRLNWEF